MRTRAASGRLLALVALVALAACGATEPAPAPSCTIEGGADGSQTLVCTDGTRIPVGSGSCSVAARPEGGAVITCPDGTVTTIAPPPGASCSATLEPDGTAIVRCSDGTEARIPPGPDGASCTVEPLPEGGSVLRCGDGTEVVLEGGEAGSSCTVRDNEDGTYTLSCTDGTEVTLSDGPPAGPCSARDNGDGTKTIACADGTEVTVSDGAPGAGCSARDNGDGTITIACPDGTEVTVSDGADGTSCSVAADTDGTYTISCTDGTSVRIWPGGEGAGAIEGRALLPGTGDHAGIEVRVEDLELATFTDGYGAYRLDGVPAGMHALLFEHTGHGTARLDGVPVLPGTYRARDVTLHAGDRLATGDAVPVALSPAGDEALFLRLASYGWSGSLHHLALATGTETWLGGAVGQAAFAGPGQVVFRTTGRELWVADVSRAMVTHLADEVVGEVAVDGQSGSAYALVDRVAGPGDEPDRGTLVHVDVQAAARTAVATDVLEGFVWPVPSGAAVLYLRRIDSATGTLELWERASATISVLGEDVRTAGVRVAPGGARVAGSRLAGDGTHELIVFDMRSGVVTVVGPAPWGASLFDGTGRWLAYHDPVGLMLHDLDTQVGVGWAWGSPVAIDPTGRSVLLLEGEGLQLWDTSTGIHVPLVSLPYDPYYLGPPEPFSADGRYVAYIVPDGWGYELVIRDLSTQAQVWAGAAHILTGAPFSPACDRAVVVGPGGGLNGDLVSIELPGGAQTVLATSVGINEPPAFLPGGEALLFRRFQNNASPGDLHLWEYASGRDVELGSSVGQGPRLLSGGAALLFVADALSNAGTLRRYDRASGTTLVLDASVRNRMVLSDRTLLYSVRPSWPGAIDEGLYLTELP